MNFWQDHNHKICNMYNISLSRFIYDDRYSANISFTAFKYAPQDGIVDTARQLLQFYNGHNQHMLNQLLCAY